MRISTGEIAAASSTPDFVRSIERDLPGVKLEIEIDLTARMLEQLLSNQKDMVFLAGPVASPGIRTNAIGSIDLVWVASRATADAGGFANALPVWSLPHRSPIHGVTLQTLAEHAVPYRSISTCNNVRMLIEIIEGGNGAAVLPETMVRRELAAGTLVEILPRPARRIAFEAAIRSGETDPLILELFERAGQFSIGG